MLVFTMIVLYYKTHAYIVLYNTPYININNINNNKCYLSES